MRLRREYNAGWPNYLFCMTRLYEADPSCRPFSKGLQDNRLSYIELSPVSANSACGSSPSGYAAAYKICGAIYIVRRTSTPHS